MSNNDFYRVRTRRSVGLLLRVREGTDFLFKKHMVFGNNFIFNIYIEIRY